MATMVLPAGGVTVQGSVALQLANARLLRQQRIVVGRQTDRSVRSTQAMCSAKLHCNGDVLSHVRLRRYAYKKDVFASPSSEAAIRSRVRQLREAHEHIAWSSAKRFVRLSSYNDPLLAQQWRWPT